MKKLILLLLASFTWLADYAQQIVVSNFTVTVTTIADTTVSMRIQLNSNATTAGLSPESAQTFGGDYFEPFSGIWGTGNIDTTIIWSLPSDICDRLFWCQVWLATPDGNNTMDTSNFFPANICLLPTGIQNPQSTITEVVTNYIIYNMQGKVVLSGAGKAPDNFSETGFAKGIYILHKFAKEKALPVEKVMFVK